MKRKGYQKHPFLIFSAPMIICVLMFSLAAHAQELRFRSLTFQERERSFYYYIPKRLEGGEGYPLMLVLHSSLSTGKEAAQTWGFTELAEKEGIAMIFPNAWRKDWNDGRDKPFGSRKVSHIDDVGFFSALMREFIEKEGADASRIYIVGAGGGGIMALRAGCELSSQIAGLAAMLASLPQNLKRSCDPSDAVPLMMINATADPFFPYKGGTIHMGKSTYGNILSTHATLDIWLQSNICSQRPVFASLDQYRSQKKAKGIGVELYNDCASGKAVMLYYIEEGGHFIPSFKPHKSNYRKNNYDSNENFNASAEIWEFLKYFKR